MAQSALPFSTNTYHTYAAITPGTAFQAGRALGFLVTTAGTVTVTLSNGQTIAIPATVGFTLLPFSAKNLVLSGGAAGTFYNFL